MARQRVMGIVLAGAEGKRLAPLTADRAKSAVPFGGLYRLVDFALSNLANAGLWRICVLTQYKSHSLDRHITTAWRLNSLLGNYVTPVPASSGAARTGRRARRMRSTSRLTSSSMNGPTLWWSSGLITCTGWTRCR